MKRKNLLTLLAAVLVFALALSACGTKETPEETTVPVTAAPTAAAETASAAADPLELTDCTLSASTWSSPNGATVHVSATPNYYADGQKADFVVRLEGDDVAVIPCQWDGTKYTASADLNAANGYCYYVILTAADGTVAEVAVNTPAAPTNEALVNMEASLTSYCSIILEESEVKDSKLTLTTGKVQVQAPVITNEGETISCQEVTLVLRFNGEELAKEVLTVAQTDTAGLYEASVDGISFEIPEMENDQKVELTLNATLTNGQILSAYGGHWFYNEDGLLPALG